MKRFLILICLLLACNLLFAEITTIYEKREGNYIIDLFKSENTEIFVNPNFIELETLEPTESKDTFIHCVVGTLDLSKEKELKKITAKIAATKKYYETFVKLKLKQVDDDVIFEDGLIYYTYVFMLE
jgi:hypothetical protein